jgi:hypothetical protein
MAFRPGRHVPGAGISAEGIAYHSDAVQRRRLSTAKAAAF